MALWRLNEPVTIKRDDLRTVAECEAVNIGLKNR